MSSTTMHSAIGTGRAAARTANQGFLVRLAVAWFNLRAKQRSRHHLGELDQRLLRDIGIDRATAAEEARRSVWQ